MNLNALPTDCDTKVIVRQENDYAEAGLDGRREIPLPFTLESINEDNITNLGFLPAGVVRAMNQVFVENVANIHGSQVRNAGKKNLALPAPEAMEEILKAYNFSGIRTTSEESMPESERIFRSQLKKQLRSLLRQGAFSANGSHLTVQTQPEATKNELPDGKISLEDFEILCESAAEQVAFEYDGMSFDFAGEPEYDEEGNFGNYAAIVDFAHDLAEKELALNLSAAGRSIKASVPK